jgi:hypothetical protein
MTKTRSPKNVATATVGEQQLAPAIEKQAPSSAEQGSVPCAPNADASTLEVDIDGETLTLSAYKRIVLRCGKASIVLNADGTIEIRGTELLSRASGQNAIRGASVSLN